MYLFVPISHISPNFAQKYGLISNNYGCETGNPPKFRMDKIYPSYNLNDVTLGQIKTPDIQSYASSWILIILSNVCLSYSTSSVGNRLFTRCFNLPFAPVLKHQEGISAPEEFPSSVPIFYSRTSLKLFERLIRDFAKFVTHVI